MARKKITVSAAFECLELRGNEHCGCDELYRTAAGKRHGAGDVDGERYQRLWKLRTPGCDGMRSSVILPPSQRQIGASGEVSCLKPRETSMDSTPWYSAMVAASAMTSTSSVARIWLARILVTSSPVAQPPTNTSESVNSPRV